MADNEQKTTEERPSRPRSRNGERSRGRDRDRDRGRDDEDEGQSEGGERKRGGGRGGRRFPRRKVCEFCVNKSRYIDYKEYRLLRGYITERGKVIPRRISGACAKHQRMLTMAIKRARDIALLSFVKR